MKAILNKLSLSMIIATVLVLACGTLDPALTPLYILLLTGFVYGFSGVKGYLARIFSASGRYGMQAIFFRSFWGGCLVFILMLISLSLLLWIGSVYGYSRLARDIFQARRISDKSEHSTIEIDPW